MQFRRLSILAALSTLVAITVVEIASPFAVPSEPPRYSLLLVNGHVIDPANHIDQIADVAVREGKIAAVRTGIPPDDAEKVVDLQGLYVVPGLVDIHVHIGYGGAPDDWYSASARANVAPFGIPPDLVLTSGVTTIVDAGSSGADTFLREKEMVIDQARVRVLAFLNIVADGMNGGLEHDVAQMDPELCTATVRKYREVIVGVKSAHFWPAKPWDQEHPPWASVDRAEECGRLANVPVMFDVFPRPPERPYEDLILKKMRPGDIHTHVFAQQFPIILPDGKLNPVLLQARTRGVIFDLGHGEGSFWFRNAVPAVEQGFVPDSFSTDLHAVSMFGSALSMTNVMSKFLAMGVPLEDVIMRSTINPAKEIHRTDLGTLSVGSVADIAVIEVLHGAYSYNDDGWARMTGNAQLSARMIIRAGRILFDPSGLSMVDWRKACKQYYTPPRLGAGADKQSTADDYPRK